MTPSQPLPTKQPRRAWWLVLLGVALTLPGARWLLRRAFAFIRRYLPGLARRLFTPDLPLDYLIAQYTDAASHFLTLDGLTVHYKTEGSGPPLVLLHGMFSSLHTWDGWVAQLSGRYRLIRVDLPYFGLTGAPASTQRYLPLYLNFVDALAEQLGLDRFTLAGNSLGGYIAWNYARRHPSRVDKLVLIDAAGYFMFPPWLLAQLSLPFMGTLLEHITPRFIATLNVRQVYGDPGKISPALITRYYELCLRPGTRRGIVSLVRQIARQGGFHPRGVSQVSAPTLVLWGDRDRWIPPAHAHYFVRDIPNARLVLYPGVGHVPMEEIPEQTAADVLAFLNA